MVAMKTSRIIAIVFCLIGLLLSIYAILIEDYKFDSNFCDISEHISCSKVLHSDYSRFLSKLGLIPVDSMFDLSNSHCGVIYYSFTLILLYIFVLFSQKWCLNLILLVTTISVVLSAYLSYILFSVLNNICILCFSIYICNLVIYISAFQFSISVDIRKSNTAGKKKRS